MASHLIRKNNYQLLDGVGLLWKPARVSMSCYLNNSSRKKKINWTQKKRKFVKEYREQEEEKKKSER